MTRRFAIILAGIALAVAACGGSGSGTQAPGATTGGGGSTATGGPGSTAGGPGGRASDPCAQLTASEAAGAMDTDPLTSTATPGDPATCRYKLADGEEALVVDFLVSGAAAQYKAFADAGSADQVAGVGDKALFERGTRRLVFTVGEVFVSVFARYVNGADAALEAATAIGKIIASRLTTGTVAPGLQITAPPVLSAGKACDLLSAAEAAGVLGKGAMTVQENPSTPQFCTYALSSNGEVLISVYLDAKGGRTAWGTFTGSLTTEPVSGLGEQALFEPSTGILFVLQGDSVLNVNVFGLSPQQTLAQDRRLMEIMLGHL